MKRRMIHQGRYSLAVHLVSVLSLLILEISLPCARAQTSDTNVINTPSIPIPGAGHDLIPGLNESVNPADGTVNISIQIPIPAGRGLTMPFAIQYSSSNSAHMTGTSTSISSVENYAYTSNNGFLRTAGWHYSLPTFSFALGSEPVVGTTDDTGQSVPGNCYYTSHYTFADSTGASFPQFLSLMAQAPTYSTSPPAGSASLCKTWPSFLSSYGGLSQYSAAFPANPAYPAVGSNGSFAAWISAPL